MSTSNPNLNRIRNLVRVTLTFLSSPYGDSPYYITEKWNRYIGFTPCVKVDKSSLPKILINYIERWKIGEYYNSSIDDNGIINILHYIYNLKTTSKGSTPLIEDMIKNFDTLIGPFISINPYNEGGIHPSMEVYVQSVIGTDWNYVNTFLRDSNLTDLLD